jgi:hypothetical protein
MSADDAIQIESSQRQHYETLLHQERMCVAVEESMLCRFRLLQPKLYKDGDQWCCLYGDNIQVGIVGFGNTPAKAVQAFSAAWDLPGGAA